MNAAGTICDRATQDLRLQANCILAKGDRHPLIDESLKPRSHFNCNI
ncbi:MAG: hypothetical protein ACKO4S_01455 [Snowella sp.]